MCETFVKWEATDSYLCTGLFYTGPPPPGRSTAPHSAGGSDPKTHRCHSSAGVSFHSTSLNRHTHKGRWAEMWEETKEPLFVQVDFWDGQKPLRWSKANDKKNEEVVWIEPVSTTCFEKYTTNRQTFFRHDGLTGGQLINSSSPNSPQCKE